MSAPKCRITAMRTARLRSDSAASARVWRTVSASLTAMTMSSSVFR